jgi:uncharacterized GH25 family protein
MQLRWSVLGGLALALAPAALGYTISGKVVAPDTQQPVARAQVWVSKMFGPIDRSGRSVASVMTDTNGEFHVQLPRSTTEMEVVIADPAGVACDGYAWIHGETDLGLIPVRRGCSLNGAIKDPGGKPLAGIHVALDLRLKPYTGMFRGGYTFNATSDVQGAFAFTNLSPGQYVYRVESKSFQAKRDVVEVSAKPAYLEIHAQPGPTIRGRVVDQAGKPVAGVKVYTEMDIHAWTDADGRYTLTGMAFGTVWLNVVGLDFVDVEGTEARSVTCRPGTEAVCDITVAQGGGLMVKMRRQDGGTTMPERVTITLSPRRTAGDTPPSYPIDQREAQTWKALIDIPSIIPGRYDVTVRSPVLSGLATNVLIVPGQYTTLNLAVQRSYTLYGKVVDEQGRPVRDADVKAWENRVDSATGRTVARSLRFSRYDGNPSASSDEKGAFTLEGLAAGTWEIAVCHTTLQEARQAVDIGTNAPPTVTFVLKKLKWLGRDTVIDL